jgi:hypothetical protein
MGTVGGAFASPRAVNLVPAYSVQEINTIEQKKKEII